MTAPSELIAGKELEQEVGELLEAILDATAFEAVTATEIASLSDALHELVEAGIGKLEAKPGTWVERGWSADRAAAIALALKGRRELQPRGKSTANDNAGAKKKNKPRKLRTKQMASQTDATTGDQTRDTDGRVGLDDLKSLLDALEVPLVAANEEHVIVHVNRACFDLLDPHAKEFDEICGVSLDALEGSSVHCLLGGATVGKRRLRGLGQRTCKAVFSLGGVNTEVKVNAVGLPGFGFSGALGTLTVEPAVAVAAEVPGPAVGSRTDVSNGNRVRVQLASSAEELLSVSQRLASTAEETSGQANVVSASSEEVSENLHTVASGMEELSHSISEIARSASSASTVAATGVDLAETTNDTVAKLGDSSSEIGKVIKVITTIAQQTNLLALNATIEAARAGEAGKGFAVVANEVKDLAKETATASEDISRKVEAIQSGTADAVAAISEINNIVNQINEIQLNIAAAVEEQTATAGEIGRNIGEAARGSGEITENIAAVATAARSTSEGAMDTKRAAEDLNRLASQWGGS